MTYMSFIQKCTYSAKLRKYPFEFSIWNSQKVPQISVEFHQLFKKFLTISSNFSTVFSKASQYSKFINLIRNSQKSQKFWSNFINNLKNLLILPQNFSQFSQKSVNSHTFAQKFQKIFSKIIRRTTPKTSTKSFYIIKERKKII